MFSILERWWEKAETKAQKEKKGSYGEEKEDMPFKVLGKETGEGD
jgi:hypothetical protein